MRAYFEQALAFTLQFEGGYVNHPKDPGGHTNKGVTLTTLRRYKPGATVADLKAISNDLVRRIYLDGYWDKVNADKLAAGVDGATFDYGVNSGPGAALKSLMKVLGGPDHVTVQKLCARRLSIYQTFKHWSSFGKGWTRRITAGEALWVKWALAGQIAQPAVKAKLEDEAATAAKKSKQQATGGAASGGGAAAAPEAAGQTPVDQVSPEAAEQLIGWLTMGLVTAGLLLAAWLLWRAWINRQRQKAYANEAGGV